MGPNRVFIYDPCPSGLQERLTIAHVGSHGIYMAPWGLIPSYMDVDGCMWVYVVSYGGCMVSKYHRQSFIKG